MGRYQESIELLDKALQIDPKCIFSLSYKAYHQPEDKCINIKNMKMGRYQESIEWYDKALQVDPKHVFSLSYKGQSLNHKLIYKQMSNLGRIFFH